MRYILMFFLVLATPCLALSPTWSKTGHRVVGEIAQTYLSNRARKAINELLDGQSLATVSNYADEVKSDPGIKEFGPWHYVNIPPGRHYADSTASHHGDLVQGIQYSLKVLKDKNNKREDRVFYLKMLIHLLGDLHQPLHVGREADRGGNSIQLQWFGKGTNLHSVWDSKMIDHYGMSYSELAGSFPRLSRRQRRNIQNGSLLNWVEESRQEAERVYDSVTVGEKLGYSYSYRYWGVVEDQLLKGGVRLAGVLNNIFS
jgi:hypothetical protein